MAGRILGKTLSLTQLFRRMRQGDREAGDRAYEEAYQELRNIAGRLVRREYEPNVGATELVNETYLRHLRQGTVQVENRQHFYSMAALAMRHVLVDLARQRKAARRGGGQSFSLEAAGDLAALAGTPEEMLSLDLHLNQLKKLDAGAAEVFSQRFFLGYTAAELEGVLGREAGDIRKDWEFAKVWLRDRIGQDMIQTARRSAK